MVIGRTGVSGDNTVIGCRASGVVGQFPRYGASGPWWWAACRASGRSARQGIKLGAGWPATTRLATGCLATSAASSWADSGTFILTDTLHNTFTELIGSNKTT